MRKLSCNWLLYSLLGLAPPVAAAAEVSVASAQDPVECYVSAPVTGELTVRNEGNEDVRLVAVKSANKLVTLLAATPAHLTVPPHSSRAITLKFETDLLLGAHRLPFDLTLRSASGTDASQRGAIPVFVQSILDDERPEIDLGVVESGNSSSKSWKLASREAGDTRFSAVLSKPDFLSVRFDDHGSVVTVSPRPNAPWGISEGFLKLGLKSTLQPRVMIKYHMEVRGDVVPSQNPVSFTPESVGATQEETVRLTRSSGKPLKLRSFTENGIHVVTRSEDCIPAQLNCALLRIVLPADTPSGLHAGTLVLSFEGIERTLPLQVGGFRLAKGQRLRSLTEDDASKTSTTLKAREPIDVANAIEKARRERTPVPAPAGTGPVLRWQVAHEDSVYGYVVYRADAEDGPFARLNREVIHSSGQEDSAAYAWRDVTAQSGRTYWYAISAVQNDGRKRKLTDPQKVVAK